MPKWQRRRRRRSRRRHQDFPNAVGELERDGQRTREIAGIVVDLGQAEDVSKDLGDDTIAMSDLHG